MVKQIKEFEKIRQWKAIRGVGGTPADENERFKSAVSQYNRFLQEGNEILDALVLDDMHEFKDAIGDTIVTLVNLAKIMEVDLEDGLEQAFDVIELRKGITTPVNDFVRYGKLSEENRLWCDEHQGNPGKEYFFEAGLRNFTPKNFIKKDYVK